MGARIFLGDSTIPTSHNYHNFAHKRKMVCDDERALYNKRMKLELDYSRFKPLVRSINSFHQPFLLPTVTTLAPRPMPLAPLPPPPAKSFTPAATTAFTPAAAMPKVSSRLDQIQKWDIPGNSKLFKAAIEPNINSIYQPPKRETVVEKIYHHKSFQEMKIEQELAQLRTLKNENSSIRSRLTKWFVEKAHINKLRRFIPFLRQDYQVSDEAHVEIPEKQAEEWEEPSMPVWTEAMEMEIRSVLQSPPNTHLTTAFAINILVKDILTLNGRSWLNDSVMEFYFNLITERSTKNPAKYPSVYTFGTFFYTRLEKGQALGRWARKLDFFSYDLLIVPIIHASHWRLVVVKIREKRIEYYDSMGNPFPACVNAIVKFLQAESREKGAKVELDLSQWSIVHRVPGIPLQNNGYDCGVFACKYAEYIARRAPITFTQNDIPFFRRCMMYEIIHRELLVH